MAQLLVRYFASARTASGMSEELIHAVTVAEAIDIVAARHGPALVTILAASSLLLDGVHVADPGIVIPDRAELDVLPPFAGG